MDKIQFDIKYRPEIEAGKYKVVTRSDNPARVVCWDVRGQFPVVAIITEGKEDIVTSCTETGLFWGAGESANDLFLVPAEPERELTGIEMLLLDWCSTDTGGAIKGERLREVAINRAKMLMSAARKELQAEMPRWKKCAPCECDKDDATIPAWIVRFDAELAGESAVVHNGHYILFEELEKLPKEV